MLRPTSPTASADYALLGFVASYESSSKYDGILAVDGETYFMDPLKRVYVARGKRRIGYSCPGWVTVDGTATLDHHFEPGKEYRFVCDAKRPPRIEEVAH